jgi:hypothetical protein
MITIRSGRPLGPIFLLAVVAGLVGGCSLGIIESGGRVADISNRTTDHLVISYVNPGGGYEAVFDEPLAPGAVAMAIRPFDRHHDGLIDGCLPGTFSAATREAPRVVATVTRLCRDQTWDIGGPTPGASSAP